MWYPYCAIFSALSLAVTSVSSSGHETHVPTSGFLSEGLYAKIEQRDICFCLLLNLAAMNLVHGLSIALALFNLPRRIFAVAYCISDTDSKHQRVRVQTFTCDMQFYLSKSTSNVEYSSRLDKPTQLHHYLSSQSQQRDNSVRKEHQ